MRKDIVLIWPLTNEVTFTFRSKVFDSLVGSPLTNL